MRYINANACLRTSILHTQSVRGVSPEESRKCIPVTQELYDAGLTASIYLGTKKFGKQIDYAVKENYSHIVIMGGSEYESGTVKIKNLVAREEKTVPVSELSEETFA